MKSNSPLFMSAIVQRMIKILALPTLDNASTTASTSMLRLNMMCGTSTTIFQGILKSCSMIQHAHTFIDEAYCVVTVKKGTVHWYSHIISAVFLVKMDKRIGGSSF